MQNCQYRIDDTFYPLVTARQDTISSFKNDQGLKNWYYMDHRLWTNPKPTSQNHCRFKHMVGNSYYILFRGQKITFKLTIYLDRTVFQRQVCRCIDFVRYSINRINDISWFLLKLSQTTHTDVATTPLKLILGELSWIVPGKSKSVNRLP